MSTMMMVMKVMMVKMNEANIPTCPLILVYSQEMPLMMHGAFLNFLQEKEKPLCHSLVMKILSC